MSLCKFTLPVNIALPQLSYKCKIQSLFWHSHLLRHSGDAFDQICAETHDCTQSMLAGARIEIQTEGRGEHFRFVLVCASLDFKEEQNQLDRLERWLFSTWWNNLVAQLSPCKSWPHRGLNYATSDGVQIKLACLKILRIKNTDIDDIYKVLHKNANVDHVSWSRVRSQTLYSCKGSMVRFDDLWIMIS